MSSDMSFDVADSRKIDRRQDTVARIQCYLIVVPETRTEHKGVRRILIRGSMLPCRLRRRKLEKLTTKWCMLKYI